MIKKHAILGVILDISEPDDNLILNVFWIFSEE